MLQPTDITATFHPSTFENSRSLGIGQLDIFGIVISYTVYPSQYGTGILVSYPSRPVMKNGVQEKDQNGKGKYFNEVFVKNLETRGMIENAVLNAMANKGVHPGQPQVQQAQPTQFQQPQTQFINGQGISNQNSFSQQSVKSSSPGASLVSAEELPF